MCRASETGEDLPLGWCSRTRLEKASTEIMSCQEALQSYRDGRLSPGTSGFLMGVRTREGGGPRMALGLQPKQPEGSSHQLRWEGLGAGTMRASSPCFMYRGPMLGFPGRPLEQPLILWSLEVEETRRAFWTLTWLCQDTCQGHVPFA